MNLAFIFLSGMSPRYPGVLVTLLLPWPNNQQSNLRKAGLIALHGSNVQLVVVRMSLHCSVKQLVTLHPQTGSREMSPFYLVQGTSPGDAAVPIKCGSLHLN